MKKLVLFDFDGTITTEDTFLEFIKYSKGATAFYLGFLLLSPLLILMKLGLFPNWKAKERVLVYFFRNTDIEIFNNWGREFSTKVLPNLIRSEALKRLNEHKANNDVIYVVSASAANWIHTWTRENHLKLISTQLEVDNRKITGRIMGKNCHGREKVERIKSEINLKGFDYIVAYGDSSGDKEMLDFADKSYYKPFR